MYLCSNLYLEKREDDSMEKLKKIFEWVESHEIFIFGTWAVSELLWYLEGHVKNKY